MKTVIVYMSKTGFTKRYANWIGTDLSCPVKSVKEFNKNSIDEYDLIIYGAGLMAGNVGGLSKWKKLCEEKNKKLIVFGTGATPQDSTDMIKQITASNLSEEEQKRIPFFYFAAGVNYEEMKAFPKFMLHTMFKSLSKKKDLTKEQQGNYAMLLNSCDFSDHKYIEPLVKKVKEWR